MKISNNYDIENKIYGGIFGLLIGDAIGVPYKFKEKYEIKDIDIYPKDLKNKTYPNVRFGTWSDDGAQSLILLSSLLDNNKLDLTDLLNRLVKWLENGYMSVDNYTFDVGIQTYAYINAYRKQKKFEIDNSPNEYHNGNGSLMRCLPLALWHKGSSKELIDLAHKQSLITHPHIRSQACCALYCLIAKNLLLGFTPEIAIKNSKHELINIYTKYNYFDALKELKNQILSYDLNECHGGSYVVDSLMSSLVCIKEPSYSTVIKKAISFGNDTDTTACIAGGLAGIRFGFNNIPEHWISGLRGKEIVYPLLKRLLETRYSNIKFI